MARPTLWAFGDSFTAGNGFSITNELPYPWSCSTGKKRAYPQLLANKLNMNCINLAFGGSGNKDIFAMLINALPNIPESDLIIIGLSSPFRDQKKATDKQVVMHLKTIIDFIQNALMGRKYLITSAFGSLVPDFFKKEELFSKEDIKNYVEWGEPNNTLLDMCLGNFCKESTIESDRQKAAFLSMYSKKDTKHENLERCKHPSNKGHEVIADILYLYVEKLYKPIDFQKLLIDPKKK